MDIARNRAGSRKSLRKNSLFTSIKVELSRNKYLYIMLTPFVLWYLVFAYKPMGGLIAAFKAYNNPWVGIENSPWVGFQNFIDFFTGPYFWRVFKNTLTISLSTLIFGFPLPIILALMLNELRTSVFKKTAQTILYLPNFISTMVVAGMVVNFLSPSYGVINLILERLGIEKQYFLIKKEYFVPIYVLLEIWKSTGFGSIIYSAALTGVDQELYDACKIDGGGKWRQLFSVTLPAILPTIIIMLILRLGNMLEVGYETIILLYQPVTYETADVISTYVFRTGLVEGKYSIATTVGLFNGAIALILVVGANYISKKTTEVGLW